MTEPPRRVNVLIASPLELEQVRRIFEAAPERTNILYDADLLPSTRYIADHTGPRPRLSPEQQQRWHDWLAQAEILFDFDWDDPENLPLRAPHLRWIQATSAGIGEFVRRRQFPPDRFVLTTAAGVHAQPLAEFVLLGMLYFARGVPQLQRWQSAHHWERANRRYLPR
jgi:phosphoglycerate dehydrogenase-like enzyme